MSNKSKGMAAELAALHRMRRRFPWAMWVHTRAYRYEGGSDLLAVPYEGRPGAPMVLVEVKRAAADTRRFSARGKDIKQLRALMDLVDRFPNARPWLAVMYPRPKEECCVCEGPHVIHESTDPLFHAPAPFAVRVWNIEHPERDHAPISSWKMDDQRGLIDVWGDLQ